MTSRRFTDVVEKVAAASLKIDALVKAGLIRLEITQIRHEDVERFSEWRLTPLMNIGIHIPLGADALTRAIRHAGNGDWSSEDLRAWAFVMIAWDDAIEITAAPPMQQVIIEVLHLLGNTSADLSRRSLDHLERCVEGESMPKADMLDTAE